MSRPVWRLNSSALTKYILQWFLSPWRSQAQHAVFRSSIVSAASAFICRLKQIGSCTLRSAVVWKVHKGQNQPPFEQMCSRSHSCVCIITSDSSLFSCSMNELNAFQLTQCENIKQFLQLLHSDWTMDIKQLSTMQRCPPDKEKPKHLNFLVWNQKQHSARTTTPSPPEFNILSALKI